MSEELCSLPELGMLTGHPKSDIQNPKSYLLGRSAPEPFMYGPLDPLGRVVPLDVRAIASWDGASSRAPRRITLARFAALRSAPLKRELANEAIEKSAPDRLLPVKLLLVREARMKLPRDKSAR